MLYTQSARRHFKHEYISCCLYENTTNHLHLRLNSFFKEIISKKKNKLIKKSSYPARIHSSRCYDFTSMLGMESELSPEVTIAN